MSEGRISRHHVARMFDPLEEFLAGRAGKPDTIARIMDLFARHYGFASEQEVNEVGKAVAELVDYVAEEKTVRPTNAFKMLRNMRVLLIGMVMGLLSGISFELLEKKS